MQPCSAAETRLLLDLPAAFGKPTEPFVGKLREARRHAQDIGYFHSLALCYEMLTSASHSRPEAERTRLAQPRLQGTSFDHNYRGILYNPCAVDCL
jgi:hypothetical protein